MGHCVSQFYFDGRWNVLDGDQHCFYLLRDNETIASELDIVRDHDLIKRTHTQGILCDDDRGRDEWEASAYVCDNEINGDRNCRGDTTMNMTLRPGEAIVWRWGHLDPVKCFGARKVQATRTPCATAFGSIAPTSARKRGVKGPTRSRREVGPQRAGGRRGQDRHRSSGRSAAPTSFVGGRLEMEGSGSQVRRSLDGKTWKEIGGKISTSSSPPTASPATSINSAANSGRGLGSSGWASSTTCKWPR